MKQRNFFGGLLLAGILISGSSFGQNMTPGEKKSEEIIIRKNGDSAQKMTVQINGNDVTINGKPLSEYHGGDVQIIKRDIAGNGFSGNFSGPGQNNMEYQLFDSDDNGSSDQAFLGVMTEKADHGVKVSEVMKGTAAQKAGMKSGDIITKVGDKEVNSPSELLAAVKAHKPGDEVTISYLRDNKEESAQVKLGEKTLNLQRMIIQDPGGANGFNYRMPNMQMPGMQMPNMQMPGGQWMPGNNFRYFFNYQNRPKIGLKIQDTEDGDGAKILDVQQGSAAAKAGLKKDDIITSLNGDKVSGVDDVTSKLAESGNMETLDIKAMRNKKEMDFQVKLPRKLKSADL